MYSGLFDNNFVSQIIIDCKQKELYFHVDNRSDVWGRN